MQDYTVIKLLLLELLLFNLQNALHIKNHAVENETQVTTEQWHFETAWFHDTEFSGTTDWSSQQLLQYTSYEENSDTELNPNENTNNTNSGADHSQTPVTSNVPNTFLWTTPLSVQNNDEIEQEMLVANNTTIVNYNRRTLPKCPNGFNGLTYFENKYSNYSICYLITEPTSFPPQCPYPTTVEYHLISHYFEITSQKHWAFSSSNVSDIGKKNCFLTEGTARAQLIPASCIDKYPGVCAYSYDVSVRDHIFPAPTFAHYCMTRYNMSCTGSYINSPLICYCKTDSESEKLPRIAFCKKLVEITNAYENNILVKLLGQHDRCWIGLHKYRESFQWSSTNTTSNYTYWSSYTDFSKTYGALGAEGWLLEEDGALNCAICEIEVEDHPQVQLHIEHNKMTNTLDVEINNAVGVFQAVTCFAQNSDNYQTIDLRRNKDDFLLEKLEFVFGSSGYYWCKALQIPNLTPTYSNTIFIATNAGYEYALLVTYPQLDTSLPESTDDVACSSLRNPLSEVIFDSMPVKIIKRNEEDETLEVLCHITINATQMSRAKAFDVVSNLLKQSSAKTTNLASIEVCLPSITFSRSQTLHWPETLIGVTTIPEELCLQEDGSPVTRTCTGNFYYGSQWLDVNGSSADVIYSGRAHLLYDLLKSNQTPSDLTTNLLHITEDTSNFTSFEIHLVSKVLKKLTTFGEHCNVTDIAKIVCNIMRLQPNELKTSQESLNSTDIILCSLDKILAKTKINDNGYMSEVTEKLVVQISNLKTTNIIGIKLGKTQNSFDSMKVNPLQYGTSQGDLIREHFDLAVVIPQQLHNDIVNCVGEQESANLITTMFYDDVLFNEQNSTNNYPDGRVISVAIPNFDCTFTTPLQVIFNTSTNNNTRLKCASWAYGINSVMESTHGQWFIEGDPKGFGNSNYQVCEFKHITHFTLLILGDTNEVSERHKQALDIITAVGSGLSILGLLVVFLTAIIFKSFRSANAVVINFSIATTGQIVFLFIADYVVAENKVLCIVFGAALHYIVLAQFCWMLTIAILQYRRFVVVFSNSTKYLVAITCSCSWGIPLIPVIIILSISRDNYGQNSYGLCYVLGNYFVFGVLLPVSLIIFINLMVFIRIMLSIAASRRKVQQTRDGTFSLELRLAIMLYFLLGLTWGFGLLAAIGGGIVYSYLFCITATLQGFIIFLYFIVINEKTRSLWINFKTCYWKGKADEYDVNTDSAATTMMQNPRNTCSDNSTNSTMLRKYKHRNDSEF